MNEKNNIIKILSGIIALFSLIMITDYKNIQNFMNLYLIFVMFISVLIIYMFSVEKDTKQSFDDVEVLKEISKTPTGQYLELDKLFTAKKDIVNVELRPNLSIFMITEEWKIAIWNDEIGNNNGLLFKTYREGNNNKFFGAIISDKQYSASVSQIYKMGKDMVFGTGTKGAINILKNTLGDDAIKDIFKKQDEKKG